MIDSSLANIPPCSFANWLTCILRETRKCMFHNTILHGNSALCIDITVWCCVCFLTVKELCDHFFIKLTKEQMRNEMSCSSSFTTGWSNNCFSKFCKHFLFFSPTWNPLCLCLTHTPLPLSPTLCFNWLLSALSFVMEMTRPESKWHYVKMLSCDSCQAISLLLYSSFRIKLEPPSQSPHSFK